MEEGELFSYPAFLIAGMLLIRGVVKEKERRTMRYKPDSTSAEIIYVLFWHGEVVSRYDLKGYLSERRTLRDIYAACSRLYRGGYIEYLDQFGRPGAIRLTEKGVVLHHALSARLAERKTVDSRTAVDV